MGDPFKDYSFTNKSQSVSGLKGQYYDLCKLYSLSNGHLDFIKEMIDVFFDQFDQFQCAINESIKDVDWLKIQKTAHKFKSSLKILGVDHLTINFESIHVLAKEKKDIEEVKFHTEIINNYCLLCVEELHCFRNSIA